MCWSGFSRETELITYLKGIYYAGLQGQRQDSLQRLSEHWRAEGFSVCSIQEVGGWEQMDYRYNINLKAPGKVIGTNLPSKSEEAGI